jgi:hypothetical protein
MPEIRGADDCQGDFEGKSMSEIHSLTLLNASGDLTEILMQEVNKKS